MSSMSLEQLIELNEFFGEDRPKTSLVYLADHDYDFVRTLPASVEVPSGCPSALLKRALEKNLQQKLIGLSQGCLEFLESDCSEDNDDSLMAKLQTMKLLYSESNKMLLEMLSEGYLHDFLVFINSYDENKKALVIKNLNLMFELNSSSWDTLAERIFILNAHDKEFLKEPLLSEIPCTDAFDLLGMLKDLTKERFTIIRQFDKKNNANSLRPAYIWRIGKSTWKQLCDGVDREVFDLDKFRNLNTDQIEKFMCNYENASQELKEMCKKDSLAITCVINDFKYENFVLNSYADNQTALRDSIVAFAMANDKIRFLQLITNRSDLLYVNRHSTKLLMQEHVYKNALDINTLRVEDFMRLSKWDFTDWPEYLEINELLSAEEFNALLGKPRQYVHFMCESKRNNSTNLDAIVELFADNLLPKSIPKSMALARELNGHKLSELYEELFYDTGIGYRNAIKLITLCGLENAKAVRNIYDANLIFEYAKTVEDVGRITLEEALKYKNELLEQEYMQPYVSKYTSYVEEMLRIGLLDVLNAYMRTNMDECTFTYLEDLIQQWAEGRLLEETYSIENLGYELEYPLSKEQIELWRTNITETLGAFTVKEIDSFEEKMFLSYKLNTRYSYKADKSIALSVMDATKKLVAVYHHGDCVGVATLRLTKGADNFVKTIHTEKELMLYLSDVTFASNIGAEVEMNSLKVLLRLALQKSCTLNVILALAEKYATYGIGVEMQKVSAKIFNNRSRNPIQYLEDNSYRGSWDSLKAYTHSTFRWIK